MKTSVWCSISFIYCYIRACFCYRPVVPRLKYFDRMTSLCGSSTILVLVQAPQPLLSSSKRNSTSDTEKLQQYAKDLSSY